MVDDDTLGKIFSWATAAWLAVAMLAVRLFHTWPNVMARINERRRDSATEKAGDWRRLRDEIARLDERCDGLQREVDECREREGEWMRRAMTAEAALLGIGMGRNEAATIVAVERLTDANKKPEAHRDGGNG